MQNQTYFSWKPDEQFEMSGLELEYLLNTLAQKLSTPEARDIIMAYEMKKVLDKKIEEGLQAGKVLIKNETPN